MTTENKTGKGRIRLNIIDFIVIIILIGAAVGIAFRFGLVERVKTQVSMDGASISFLVQNIQEASYSYFNIGEEFEDVTHKCSFGTLESKQEFPAETYITDINGNIIKTYVENDRIDLRGVMSSVGKFTDEGFLLDGIHFIAPGSSINIRSSVISVWITVTDIVKTDPNVSTK